MSGQVDSTGASGPAEPEKTNALLKAYMLGVVSLGFGIFAAAVLFRAWFGYIRVNPYRNSGFYPYGLVAFLAALGLVFAHDGVAAAWGGSRMRLPTVALLVNLIIGALAAAQFLD